VTHARSLAAAAAAALVFAVLATANSGGYRYGVSDQAFYVPATVLALDATAFPRDAPLVAAQSRLLVADELMAETVRQTGAALPAVALAAYALTLLTLFAAAIAFGRALGLAPAGIAVLLLLMTFRHRIAKTGANSLEGYMHPRMLAFALGVAALAALVRGRLGWSAAAVAAAALVHPTTAFWFGLAVFAGVAAGRPAWRPPLAAAAALLAVTGAWAVLAGPLANGLVLMDPTWLAVLAGKDYLFPTEWPLYAWILNLLYPVVVGLLYRRRARLGLAAEGERMLVAGLLVLVTLFLVSVPFTAWRVALAVQLQVTRVFWVLDFVMAAYLAWWLTSARQAGHAAPVVSRRRRPWRPAIVAAVLLAASAGRGVYVLTIESPERQLVTTDLARSPWHDVMAWLERQPGDWHVLADPGHASRYGSSVRVAARRDTLIETTKDSAVAMYDRAVAMRVADRLAAVGAYDRLTTLDLHRLDARYDLDVAVAERGQVAQLPVLYRNRQFVVYDLR
jgi:hypothetical protein